MLSSIRRATAILSSFSYSDKEREALETFLSFCVSCPGCRQLGSALFPKAIFQNVYDRNRVSKVEPQSWIRLIMMLIPIIIRSNKALN